jgi:hypothetical protein
VGPGLFSWSVLAASTESPGYGAEPEPERAVAMAGWQLALWPGAAMPVLSGSPAGGLPTSRLGFTLRRDSRRPRRCLDAMPPSVHPKSLGHAQAHPQQTPGGGPGPAASMKLLSGVVPSTSNRVSAPESAILWEH